MKVYRIKIDTKDLDFIKDVFSSDYPAVFESAQSYLEVILVHGHILNGIDITIIKEYK